MATRLLTLRDVTGMTALSRSAVYALMAESRFPKPIRIGSRAVRWVGGARLHRQPSPSWLRSADCVAGTIRDPQDRQQRTRRCRRATKHLRSGLAHGPLGAMSQLTRCATSGWRGGTARPLRTPGGARPCRAGERAARPPGTPCRCARMGERRTARAAGRVSSAVLAGRPRWPPSCAAWPGRTRCLRPGGAVFRWPARWPSYRCYDAPPWWNRQLTRRWSRKRTRRHGGRGVLPNGGKHDYMGRRVDL